MSRPEANALLPSPTWKSNGSMKGAVWIATRKKLPPRNVAAANVGIPPAAKLRIGSRAVRR
jgi:hypothetical protein